MVELFPDVQYSGPLLRPNKEDKAAANARRGPGGGSTPPKGEAKRMAINTGA